MSSAGLSQPEQLGWLIKSIQYRHQRALDAKLAPLGTSLVQWNALREIQRNPDASQHHLAERTFNSDQAFGTLAARLQSQGLVQARSGPGRAIIHRLTRKGEAMLRAGQKVMVETVTDSFATLTEGERAELTRLLTTVLGGWTGGSKSKARVALHERRKETLD